MIDGQRNTRRVRAVLLSMTASLLLAVGPAHAVDFSDQRVEVIVPFGEGGGADTYTRFMARMLAPKLPGEPTVVIRNIPGGGSVNGANWFEQNADKDGTHLAVASTATTMTYALQPDDPRIQYNPQNWQAFLATPMGRVIYVHSSTGIETLEDLKNFDGELVMAADAPTGGEMPSLLSLHLLGVDVKPVFGTGGGEGNLAFERGELTVDTDITSAFRQRGLPLVEAGTAVPLFTFGFEENGEIVRDPNFPDLPSFPEAYEMLHGQPPSGPEFEVWTALFRMAVMSSKVLVLPAGTPDDVVDAYEAAAADLVDDESFIAQSGEVIGTYPQLTGDAADRLLSSAATISDEAREWIAGYLKDRFDFDL